MALFAYLRDRNEEALKTVRMNVKRCEKRKDGFVKRFGWHTKAILFTLEKEEELFQESLQHIVRLHRIEAQQGSLREDPRGLLCLSGLALVRLGGGNRLYCQCEQSLFATVPTEGMRQLRYAVHGDGEGQIEFDDGAVKKSMYAAQSDNTKRQLCRY